MLDLRSPIYTTLLQKGAIHNPYLMPEGSNYTFRVQISLDGSSVPSCYAIYKPRVGEAPLWDFPYGTLYKREYAAYLVSETLGWNFIPITSIREGPHGIGSLQLFVESHPNTNYFTLEHNQLHDVKRIATFDYITNNADRKASHCFLGLDGNVWGIDHGLTFHADPKLRTVIWDFQGEPIPPDILKDLERLSQQLSRPKGILEELNTLIHPNERNALANRIEDLLTESYFPYPFTERPVPWPWF